MYASMFLYSCKPKTSEQAPAVNSGITALDEVKAKNFIDSINARFSEEFAAGDSAGLASHYWPDAEILLDNSEPIKGNEILSAWGSMTKSTAKSFTFSTTDIAGNSEFLIETGQYLLKDAQDALIDRGKYVVVWQNRNGVWKLYRDMGNTSLPASR